MEYSNLEKLVGTDWADFLKPFMCPDAEGKCQYDPIAAKMKELYQLPKEQQPYPMVKNIFRAFKETPLSKLRLILLGQDPYPRAGYANGMAFATDHAAFDANTPMPPSLEKIYETIERDVYHGKDESRPKRGGILGKPKEDGTINKWTDQGVLLLNAALTIGMINTDKKGWIPDPNSHAQLWEPFVKFVISNLWRVKPNLIFFAWGGMAKGLVRYERTGKDTAGNDGWGESTGVNVFNAFLLTGEHPAAASRAKAPWAINHFSAANLIIRINNLGAPIEW